MNDDFFRCFSIACSFFRIPLFHLLFRVWGGGVGWRAAASSSALLLSLTPFSRERERDGKNFFLFSTSLSPTTTTKTPFLLFRSIKADEETFFRSGISIFLNLRDW